MATAYNNLWDTFVWFMCFGLMSQQTEFFRRNKDLCASLGLWIPEEYGTRVANFILAAPPENAAAFLRGFQEGERYYPLLLRFDDYRKEIGYEIGQISPPPESLVRGRQELSDLDDDEDDALDES